MYLWTIEELKSDKIPNILGNNLFKVVFIGPKIKSIMERFNKIKEFRWLKEINRKEKFWLDNRTLLIAYLLGGGYKNKMLTYLILFKQLLDAVKVKNEMILLATPIPLPNEIDKYTEILENNKNIKYRDIYIKNKTKDNDE